MLRINSELVNIYDWLIVNKVTLNLKKTKYLIFQPRQKINYNLLPPWTLAGQCLEQVSSLKHLGIYIDDHLSGHDHITYICDKISKCINIVIKVKRYLGNQCLTSIYYSLIYPYFYMVAYWRVIITKTHYCSLYWRLQNKAIRTINDVSLQDHITPHYVNLGLFGNVVKMYTCLFIYGHLYNKKPCNFSISLVSEHPNYSTRTAPSLQLFPPYLKLI